MNKAPSILFITGPSEDYLADGILHGLRSLYGSSVVDYPKCEPLYKNCSDASFSKVRGHGFTLYKTLDDIDVDRFDILNSLRSGIFDLVIFGNIQRSYAIFVDWLPWLQPKTTILLDGEDTQSIAPYAGHWWRRPEYWLLPKAHKQFIYFKREWGPTTLKYRTYRLLPFVLCNLFYKRLHLRTISFSIPESHIVKSLSKKTKEFAAYIVDPEVAALFAETSSKYRFTSETEYYGDLQTSRFGITTKRAGWDCLRHYELAANGCVPCFRDLDLKPTKCAPHGLGTENCISYHSVDDLLEKIRLLTPARYEELQAGCIAWAKANTTVAKARMLMESNRSNINRD
ncbi:MAG: hypothetical protein M0Q51_14405 [Bacteroidales bacterium]|nr:hypothetical protein [Bacteroidales bacterium]